MRQFGYHRSSTRLYALPKPKPKRRKSKRKPAEAFTDKKEFAAHMRKHMTPAEKVLWRSLEFRGFKAQVIIKGYIVDFCHLKSMLCIEADGPIHDKQKDYDERRDAIIQKQGYRMLRFTNFEIQHHPAQVLNRILEAV